MNASTRGHSTTEEVVEMLDAEEVRRVRLLAERGWGAKRIARELGIARNTVRRWLEKGDAAATQVRHKARRLDAEARRRAVELFADEAEGNAAVVARELRGAGVHASLRTVQRAVAGERAARAARDVATVRFETEPGEQMQVDFGEKLVRVGDALVKVFVLVAVLAHSRRIFVKAFSAERGDDWREGIAEAFLRFGGVPRALLIDNARALVAKHVRGTREVTLHPAFRQFCIDWGVDVRACVPYRAQTKGKTENAVRYVKHNALAGYDFPSWSALEAHLARWMDEADRRVHRTTGEQPLARFERDEREALRALPRRPPAARHQRLARKVSNDCFVDVETVRYSVPWRLARQPVEVLVLPGEVHVFHGTELVARHARTLEPRTRVIDPAHLDGLMKREAQAFEPRLPALGRTLDAYAEVVS